MAVAANAAFNLLSLESNKHEQLEMKSQFKNALKV